MSVYNVIFHIPDSMYKEPLLMHLYTRVYVQTHVFKISVCKGSQWVLFVATLEAV